MDGQPPLKSRRQQAIGRARKSHGLGFQVEKLTQLPDQQQSCKLKLENGQDWVQVQSGYHGEKWFPNGHILTYVKHFNRMSSATWCFAAWKCSQNVYVKSYCLVRFTQCFSSLLRTRLFDSCQMEKGAKISNSNSLEKNWVSSSFCTVLPPVFLIMRFADRCWKFLGKPSSRAEESPNLICRRFWLALLQFTDIWRFVSW